MIEIKPSQDPRLLAQLNEGVHILHCELEPDVFKSYEASAMEAHFRKLFESEEARAFVAFRDGEAIGFVLAVVQEQEENAFKYSSRSLYIDQIYVAEEARKTGTGKRLLDKALELAREWGISDVQLDHWISNENAGEFFRQNGFSYSKMRMRFEGK